MNQTVIVTGGANGIGREIAGSFARNSFSVVIADIDEENGKKAADNIGDNGGEAQFIRCDVSSVKDITSLVEETVQKFQRIDVVINNAGISEFSDPMQLTADDWDRVLNTNLRSCFLLSREAAKRMKDHNGGCIINIASTRALMSEKHSEAYAASKGGILALTHAMSLSFAEMGIRVNCISPGWIHTGSRIDLREIDHSQHPSGRVGEPGDIARACLFLANPDNDFINGENLVIDGGMTRKIIYEK
jgi:NAD(P)-dependent dehydrogenase (short-subunit alcohol dehydrogenase family)